MKGLKNRFAPCLVLILFSLLAVQKGFCENLIFPDFKTSMLREMSTIDRYLNRQMLYESANPKYVQIFEDIYRRNIQEAQNGQNHFHRIPPIVHQIWLGSKVPEKYRVWMESWTKICGWKYMLWTDEEVKGLRLYNQDLYKQSVNYGEKSDILRLEILFQYGGLYVDTDFECVQPEKFDELHRCFDFYIGFEPLEHGSVGKFNMFKMCNALIAAIPGHPLIKDLIVNMKANYLAYRPHSGPIATTGPSYITRIICEYVESNVDAHRNMFFPSTVFYPFSAIDVEKYCINSDDALPIFPETLGIHYWNMSWVQCDTKKNQYKEKKSQLPKLELKNGIW